MLQHIIYHPLKVERSCSQKNGRALGATRLAELIRLSVVSNLQVNESHDEETQREDSKLFWAASQGGSVRQAWAGDKRHHLCLDIHDLTRGG